jgi:transposase
VVGGRSLGVLRQRCVDQLDLSAINAVYQKEKRGQPPYNPRLMTKLLVYGYCTGVFSSRRIKKRLREELRNSASVKC